MREPKRSTQVFLISFCVTLVTLGTIFVLLLLIWLPLTREQEKELPAAQPLVATEEEALSLLFISCPTVSDPPNFLAIFSDLSSLPSLTSIISISSKVWLTKDCKHFSM